MCTKVHLGRMCTRVHIAMMCTVVHTQTEASMKIRTMVDVGGLVRTTRERAGLTQVELARTAGVSREWLVKLESGRSRAEMPRVLDVLSVLGVALDARPDDARRG